MYLGGFMIYLVEDDPSILKLVTYTLKSQGFDVQGFDLPSDFEKAVKRRIPDLILLDIMLPEVDGLTILSKIRNDPNTEKIPVILLTAKSSEYDKIYGLDNGADDYITKPFSMLELISRIKAVLRRASPNISGAHELFYREIYMNLDQHVVQVNEVPVILTLKEFDLLRVLLENKGHVLTREQLLIQVWGYDFEGESRTIDVHMRMLRSKLEPYDLYIETIRGVGYKIGVN